MVTYKMKTFPRRKEPAGPTLRTLRGEVHDLVTQQSLLPTALHDTAFLQAVLSEFMLPHSGAFQSSRIRKNRVAAGLWGAASAQILEPR